MHREQRDRSQIMTLHYAALNNGHFLKHESILFHMAYFKPKVYIYAISAQQKQMSLASFYNTSIRVQVHRQSGRCIMRFLGSSLAEKVCSISSMEVRKLRGEHFKNAFSSNMRQPKFKGLLFSYSLKKWQFRC